MKNKLILKNSRGFTLVEIMVVVVIIAIFAAAIVPKIMSRPDQARMVKAKQDILSLESALDLYKLDNGFYPSTDQGLEALISKPSTDPIPQSWKSDGYIQKLPQDPWGHAYQYINENDKLKIFSFGPKGSGGNSEIGNWDTESKS